MFARGGQLRPCTRLCTRKLCQTQILEVNTQSLKRLWWCLSRFLSQLVKWHNALPLSSFLRLFHYVRLQVTYLSCVCIPSRPRCTFLFFPPPPPPPPPPPLPPLRPRHGWIRLNRLKSKQWEADTASVMMCLKCKRDNGQGQCARTHARMYARTDTQTHKRFNPNACLKTGTSTKGSFDLFCHRLLGLITQSAALHHAGGEGGGNWRKQKKKEGQMRH